jgi:ABC-2 type transport system permease protein
MGRIRFLIKKEFLQIRRDRAMMAILFLMPIIQLLILGYAVSSEVRNVRLVVCDLDRTPLSRDLIGRFRESSRFKVRYEDPREARIGGYLDDGRASMALVIPAGLSADLARGMPSRLQILIDGQDSNTSTVALGYARGILENYLEERLASAAGALDGVRIHLLVPEVRVWHNEDMKASHYMVPGIVVFMLTMITSLLSAMGLVREKEIGTLEQLLVSPLKKRELLIGKIIPFSALGFMLLVLSLVFAKLWYHIPIVGNLGLFVLFVLIFQFTTLGVGLLVSASAQTQQQAMFMTVFLLFFFMIMSDFIFPIANMPKAMRILSYLDPMRYMMVATREIFLKGTTIRSLYPQGLALVVFGGVIFSFAAWRFQNRMK